MFRHSNILKIYIRNRREHQRSNISLPNHLRVADFLIGELRAEVVEIHHIDPPDLQILRKRWGAEEIIRDLRHIKEDIKRVYSLQHTGKIDTNEAIVYFIRMHDFDDNWKLDGKELIVAMRHSFEHLEKPGDPDHFEEIERIVDSFFAYDDNNDGYLNYAELRKHLSTTKDKLTDEL